MMPDTAVYYLAEHPLRVTLSNEVHARPHEQLDGAMAGYAFRHACGHGRASRGA